MLCFSESHKALSCFLDASCDLLVDNFLITMMSQVSQDTDARHLEVLYYLQVQQPVCSHYLQVQQPVCSHSDQLCLNRVVLTGKPATRHKWTHPAITPANQAGTRFTYPGGMEGWVDLGSPIAARMVIEPTTAWSQVRRPTVTPPSHPMTFMTSSNLS